MSGPQTEAGRALLVRFKANMKGHWMIADILAIEAEARKLRIQTLPTPEWEWPKDEEADADRTVEELRERQRETDGLLVALREIAEAVDAAPEAMRAIFERVGTKFDKWPAPDHSGAWTDEQLASLDPETRWQGLAFTAYAHMADLSSRARTLLTDSEPAARRAEEALVAPWREALEAILVLPPLKGPRLMDAWLKARDKAYAEARALLQPKPDNGESPS